MPVAGLEKLTEGFISGYGLAQRRRAQEQSAKEAAENLKLKKLRLGMEAGRLDLSRQSGARDAQRLELEKQRFATDQRVKKLEAAQKDFELKKGLIGLAKETDGATFDFMFNGYADSLGLDRADQKTKDFQKLLKGMGPEMKQGFVELLSKVSPMVSGGQLNAVVNALYKKQITFDQAKAALSDMSKRSATQGALYGRSLPGGAEELARLGELGAAEGVANIAAKLQEVGGGQPTADAEVPSDETLWGKVKGITGFVPGLRATAQGVTGQANINVASQKLLEDRQSFATAQQTLIRALAINPRFPVAEMNAIRKEINIAPSVFTDEKTLRSNMISVDKSLRTRQDQYLNAANDPTLPKDTRQAYVSAAKAMSQFLDIMGVPEGASADSTSKGAMEELGNLVDTVIKGVEGKSTRFDDMSLDQLGGLDLSTLSDDDLAAAASRWNLLQGKK